MQIRDLSLFFLKFILSNSLEHLRSSFFLSRLGMLIQIIFPDFTPEGLIADLILPYFMHVLGLCKGWFDVAL